MTASPYVREPWAGASADTWSEATPRSKDTRVRKKTWRAEHRANRQGSPGEENSIPVLILQVMKEHQFILLYKARSGQPLTWETQIMVSVTVEKVMVG